VPLAVRRILTWGRVDWIRGNLSPYAIRKLGSYTIWHIFCHSLSFTYTPSFTHTIWKWLWVLHLPSKFTVGIITGHDMFLWNTHPNKSLLQNCEARLNFVHWYFHWVHDGGSPCSFSVAMKLGLNCVDTWPIRTMALASLSSHEVPFHDVRLLWGVLWEQLGLLGSFFSLTPHIQTDILKQLLNISAIIKSLCFLSARQGDSKHSKNIWALFTVFLVTE
jgi:hypothetical protein